MEMNNERLDEAGTLDHTLPTSLKGESYGSISTIPPTARPHREGCALS